jgi:hypothetical protein
MTIEDQVRKLEDMSIETLKTLFENYFNRKPLGWSKYYFVSTIGYRMQEMAYGGLDPKLAATFATLAGKSTLKRKQTNIYPTGTCLIKRYKGQDYIVKVLDYGFLCDNKTFKTLSGVAAHISGRKISGNVFFNVNVRRP